jgi:N-acetylglucosamine-6-phosphate deacetylase
MLILTELELYTPRQVIPDAVLVIEGQRIVRGGPAAGLGSIPPSARHLRLPGRRALPGFIDVHTHGLLGKDVFSTELDDVIRLLPRFGVTSFLATTVTLPMEDVLARLRAMDRILQAPPAGARCLGIHLEGNFLSPKRTGMANAAWCQPLTPESFESLQAASGGRIKMVTFAPEEGRAMEMIPYLLERGIIPSLGHSDATYEQAAEAVRLGLAHATHTFNAMSPLHQRAPGVVGAVLALPQITAQLIADGHHVHPGAMRLLLNAKGADGVCLVSDSAPFAALPDGTYPWEGYTLIVKDGTCRLPDGTLAGAHTLLDTGFRTLVGILGLPPSEAAICACEVPARTLGLLGCKGQLLPGCDADLVLLDEDWQVEMTIAGGEIVYRRGG